MSDSIKIDLPPSVKEKLDLLKYSEQEDYVSVIDRLATAFTTDDEQDLELADTTIESIKLSKNQLNQGKGLSHADVKRDFGL